MKRITTSFIALTFSASVFAQNPASTVLSTNFNDVFGGSINPTGWVSANLTTANVVSASAPGYGGSSSAAKIETKVINTLFGIPLPPQIPPTSGILISGTIGVVGTAVSLKQGIPYTSKPEGIAYWTKYAPIASDSAFAYLILSKWNTTLNKRDTIGIMGDTITSAISSWTKRTKSITYANTTNVPDTMLILFSSSSRTAAQLGSIFYVDEISLYPTGTSGLNEQENSGLAIYPNPAINTFTINYQNTNATKITICDISGKNIYENKLLKTNTKLEIDNLCNGVYFVSIFNENNDIIGRKKVVILK